MSSVCPFRHDRRMASHSIMLVHERGVSSLVLDAVRDLVLYIHLSPGHMTLPATQITDDPYRLPRHVTPTRYELRLEPDLDNRTFAGHVTITVTVHEPTSEILLNAAELEVTSARMTDIRGITEKGAIQLQQERQRCCIRFATTCEAGTWQLTLSFNGTLNDKLRGFYRSTYKDSNGSITSWLQLSLKPRMHVVPFPAGTSRTSKRSLPSPWSSIPT